jgi:prepilin peptidase CpaA
MPVQGNWITGLGNLEAMPGSVLAAAVLAVLVVCACVVDVRTHRIPNRLVVSGAILGFLSQVLMPGQGEWASSLGGMAIGMAVLIPMYVLRAMGAGDVKMMGMVGAFVGPTGVLAVALLTFLAGGVLALAYALRKGAVLQMFQNVKEMLFGAVVNVAAGGPAHVDAPAVSVGRLPYGLAIAVGTLGYLGMSLCGMSMF